ncbi:nucleotidyltransferase family protein [Camelliibacillus cellulosilyticus]|uniref:Nucleotidyltransferase family protein n=1 Tax=Camelliibacillus cellulosilyticus TaxID=2174486 RepID=A0ABV9GN03_9BACL
MRESIWLPRFRFIIISGNSQKSENVIKCHQRSRENILKKFVTLPGITRYLFGSWARGEERSSSDIDLSVLYESPLPRGTLAKLRLAFVDLATTNTDFKEPVLQETSRWNDRSKD